MFRFASFAALAVSAITASAQITVYVDADATGPMHDGSSWCDAFLDLQDALEPAAAGTTIRVADGTYAPDWGTGDRWATFRLVNDVTLEGGYAGCGAPDPDERDVRLYETILSGDLSGNDGPNFENNNENSYHVVTGNGTNATAAFDGFTVTGGNDNSESWPHGGGGMLNQDYSCPTIVNCVFSGNSADSYGGGMHNDWQSSPTLTSCTFSGNSADSGGGMENWASDPTLTNCTFSGNSAIKGGGMCNFSSDPIITNCMFTGNTATAKSGYCGGGGLFNNYSSPILTNCTFYGNMAGCDGGGIYTYGGTPTLINCILWGDTQDEIFGSPAVTYSDIEGGYPGIGNRMFDPLFVVPDAGNCRLSEGSLCINAGDPDFAPELGATDLDGHARVLCGRVDMGAYEFGIGDHDCDQTVNLLDFAQWQTCMTGPYGGPYGSGCEVFDFEYDGDVDLDDYAALQTYWTSP